MRYSAEQYAKALYQVLRDKDEDEIRKTIEKFVSDMKEDGLIALLPAILEEMPPAIKQAEGIEDIYVDIAHEIRDDLQELALDILDKKEGEAEVSVRVRPEVIGGIRIRGKDTVYDATVKNRIDRLRDSFVHAA